MEISNVTRVLPVCLLFAVAGFLYADTPSELIAAGNGVYPVDEMMTISPGVAFPYVNGADNDNDGILNSVADHDYGGVGSRCVGSSSAHSGTTGAKGLYRSVLRFDSGAMPSVASMSSLSLDMYILNGNHSAYSIYNFEGTAGYFTVSLVYDGWNTGVGTPSDAEPTIANPNITDAYETDPLTSNNLDAMLADHGAIDLVTLYYDASYSYSQGAHWFSFDISSLLDDQYFIDAMNSGDTFSLLLSPTWIDANNDGINDNQVDFNFTAYSQYGSAVTTYRTNSVGLTYTVVPEPACIAIAATRLAMMVRRRRK